MIDPICIEIPKITILEYELIINKKLYESKKITEEQYDKVNKIIYEKISKYNNSKK